MTDPRLVLELKLASLRRAFAGRLADDMHQLRLGLQTLQCAERSEDAAEDARLDLKRIAHRIAGGAQTFGQPGLTQPAVALEEAIDKGDAAYISRQTAGLITQIQLVVQAADPARLQEEGSS